MNFWTIKSYAPNVDGSKGSLLSSITQAENVSENRQLSAAQTFSADLFLTDPNTAALAKAQFVEIFAGRTSPQTLWASGYTQKVTIDTATNLVSIDLADALIYLARYRIPNPLEMTFGGGYLSVKDFLMGRPLADGSRPPGRKGILPPGWNVVWKDDVNHTNAPGAGDSWYGALQTAGEALATLGGNYNFGYRLQPGKPHTFASATLEIGVFGDPSGLTVWGGKSLLTEQQNAHPQLTQPNVAFAQEHGKAVVENVHYEDDLSNLKNIVWVLGRGTGVNQLSLGAWFGNVTQSDGVTAATGVTRRQFSSGGDYYYFGPQKAHWTGNTYQLVARQDNDGSWMFGVANSTSVNALGPLEDEYTDHKAKDDYQLLASGLGRCDWVSTWARQFTIDVLHPRTSPDGVPQTVQPGQTIDVRYASLAVNNSGQPALSFPNTTDPNEIAKLKRCAGMVGQFTPGGYSATYTMGRGKQRPKRYEFHLADQIVAGHSWHEIDYAHIHWWCSEADATGLGTAREDRVNARLELQPGSIVVSNVKHDRFFGPHKSVEFDVTITDGYLDVWFAKPYDGSLKGISTGDANKPYAFLRLAMQGSGKKSGFYTTWDGTPATTHFKGALTKSPLLDGNGRVINPVPGVSFTCRVHLLWSGGTYEAHVSYVGGGSDGSQNHDIIARWTDKLKAITTYGAFGWHAVGGTQNAYISKFHSITKRKKTRTSHGGKGKRQITIHDAGGGHIYAELDENAGTLVTSHLLGGTGLHATRGPKVHGPYYPSTATVTSVSVSGGTYTVNLTATPQNPLAKNGLQSGWSVQLADGSSASVTVASVGYASDGHVIASFTTTSAAASAIGAGTILVWDPVLESQGLHGVVHTTFYAYPRTKGDKRAGMAYMLVTLDGDTNSATVYYADGSIGKGNGAMIVNADGTIVAVAAQALTGAEFTKGLERQGVILFDAGEFDSTTQAVDIWAGGTLSSSLTPSSTGFYYGAPNTIAASWLQLTTDATAGMADSLLQLTPGAGQSVRWYDTQITDLVQTIATVTTSITAGTVAVSFSQSLRSDALTAGTKINYDQGDSYEELTVTSVQTSGGKITGFTATFAINHGANATCSWNRTKTRTHTFKKNPSMEFPVYVPPSGTTPMRTGATGTISAAVSAGSGVVVSVDKDPVQYGTVVGDTWVLGVGTATVEVCTVSAISSANFTITFTTVAHSHASGDRMAMKAAMVSGVLTPVQSGGPLDGTSSMGDLPSSIDVLCFAFYDGTNWYRAWKGIPDWQCPWGTATWLGSLSTVDSGWTSIHFKASDLGLWVQGKPFITVHGIEIGAYSANGGVTTYFDAHQHGFVTHKERIPAGGVGPVHIASGAIGPFHLAPKKSSDAHVHSDHHLWVQQDASDSKWRLKWENGNIIGHDGTMKIPINAGPRQDASSGTGNEDHPNFGILAMPADNTGTPLGIVANGNSTDPTAIANIKNHYLVFNSHPNGYWLTDPGVVGGKSWVPGYGRGNSVSNGVQSTGFAVVTEKFDWTKKKSGGAVLQGPHEDLFNCGKLLQTPDAHTGEVPIHSKGGHVKKQGSGTRKGSHGRAHDHPNKGHKGHLTSGTVQVRGKANPVLQLVGHKGTTATKFTLDNGVSYTGPTLSTLISTGQWPGGTVAGAPDAVILFKLPTGTTFDATNFSAVAASTNLNWDDWNGYVKVGKLSTTRGRNGQFAFHAAAWHGATEQHSEAISPSAVKRDHADPAHHPHRVHFVGGTFKLSGGGTPTLNFDPEATNSWLGYLPDDATGANGSGSNAGVTAITDRNQSTSPSTLVQLVGNGNINNFQSPVGGNLVMFCPLTTPTGAQTNLDDGGVTYLLAVGTIYVWRVAFSKFVNGTNLETVPTDIMTGTGHGGYQFTLTPPDPIDSTWSVNLYMSTTVAGYGTEAQQTLNTHYTTSWSGTSTPQVQITIKNIASPNNGNKPSFGFCCFPANTDITSSTYDVLQKVGHLSPSTDATGHYTLHGYLVGVHEVSTKHYRAGSVVNASVGAGTLQYDRHAFTASYQPPVVSITGLANPTSSWTAASVTPNWKTMSPDQGVYAAISTPADGYTANPVPVSVWNKAIRGAPSGSLTGTDLQYLINSLSSNGSVVITGITVNTSNTATINFYYENTGCTEIDLQFYIHSGVT